MWICAVQDTDFISVFFLCIYLLRTLNLNPVMFKQTKKKEKKYRRDKERIIDKITD